MDLAQVPAGSFPLFAEGGRQRIRVEWEQAGGIGPFCARGQHHSPLPELTAGWVTEHTEGHESSAFGISLGPSVPCQPTHLVSRVAYGLQFGGDRAHISRARALESACITIVLRDVNRKAAYASKLHILVSACW